MAKNMTRKGLALGAAFAMVGTALVAAPAQAAGEVTLEVNTGIGNSTIIGETFTLRAGLSASVPVGNIAQLKYAVTNADGTALTFTTPTNNSAVVTDTNGDDTAYVVTPGSTSTTVANTLAIATAATETSSVSVVAWIDSDLDGVQDSGEYSSSAVTVTFVKAADVAWAVDFTTPVVGDTKFEAVVSAGDINLAQLGTNPVSVLFKETTTALGTPTTAGTEDNSELIAASVVAGTNTMKANNTFSFDFDGDAAGEAVTTVLAGKRYTAQAVYKLGGSEAAANVVGTAVAKLSAAATLDAIAAPTTDASDNFTGTGTGIKVRSSVTTIPVTIAATLSSEPAAGVAVTVKVTETGNTSVATDGVISAGGESFTSTAGATESFTFSAVTDADGEVSFNLSASGVEAGNAVSVWAYAQGVNTAGGNKATYTWTTAVVDALAVVGILGTNAEPVAASEADYVINYAALDQFGALLTGAHRVKASDGTNTRYVNIVNGRASVTMPGVTADKTVTANVQIQDSTTSNWADVDVNNNDATATGDDAVTQGVQVGSFNAVSSVTISAGATTGLVLNLNDYADADTALGETAPTVAGGTTLSGYVKDSTTAVTHGAVTLSGAGLLFKSGSVTSVGSITVLTDPATGQYSGVNVYSNTAGEHTVTATSNGATDTVDITFAVAANDTGVNLVIDAADYAVPGSTMVVKGTLTDKYGNAVTASHGTASAGAGAGDNKFVVEYDGPGFLVGSLPTATDSNGAFEFRVLLGSSDSGSATVTVTYDGDDTAADDTATPQITATKTIQIGTPAVATWTKNLGSGEVKMYAKNIVGAGKVQFMLNGAEVAWVRAVDGTDPKLRSANGFYYLVRTVELVEGQKNVLEIYVDGVRTTRTAYTY